MDLLPVVVTLFSVSFIAGIVWYIYTYKIFRNRQYLIQKWLLLIPICKSIWQIQQALVFLSCPWIKPSFLVYSALFAEDIISILSVTCFNTFMCSILYLLSIGWTTTVFVIDKNSMTNSIFIGGSLYLVQLALNYSRDQQVNIYIFIVLILAIEYFLIFYNVRKNLNKRIRLIKNMLE